MLSDYRYHSSKLQLLATEGISNLKSSFLISLLGLQREKFNQKMGSLNQEFFRVDAYKQKMETYAAELQTQRLAERKRIENENNFRQQISNLENEMEELNEQGMFNKDSV